MPCVGDKTQMCGGHFYISVSQVPNDLVNNGLAWVFVLAVLLGGAAYVVGGVLVSGRGQKSLAAHPHYRMWVEVLSLVRDGVGLVASGGTGGRVGSRSLAGGGVGRAARAGPQKKDKAKSKKEKAGDRPAAATGETSEGGGSSDGGGGGGGEKKAKKSAKQKASSPRGGGSGGGGGGGLSAPLAAAEPQPFEKLVGVVESEHTDAFGRVLLR